MDIRSSIAALGLFNEKANKLEELSFTKKISGSGVTISGQLGQATVVERHGPDEESIDAFVLTMRFFVQDNETTSLRNMADIYSKIPIDKVLVGKFNAARAKTNAALDNRTPISLNDEVLTYRVVFDVFLYGGLAHANPEKKRTYDAWARDPFVFSLLQNEFVFGLGILESMIFYTRALNQVAIRELESQTTTGDTASG
ncbi:MAG: hypothetical protein HY678_12610 [Chloroflexi bacterium]|nr:hypothetical protein [Chloroflexota bacterium]